jgi:hypothetical protein
VDRERAAGGHNVPGGADTYAQCICSTVVHGERNGSLSGPRKSQNLPISAQHPRDTRATSATRLALASATCKHINASHVRFASPTHGRDCTIHAAAPLSRLFGSSEISPPHRGSGRFSSFCSLPSFLPGHSWQMMRQNQAWTRI